MLKVALVTLFPIALSWFAYELTKFVARRKQASDRNRRD